MNDQVSHFSHLSEEQFSGLLLERSDLLTQDDAGAREHLAQCAGCRAELERVRDSLASFNAMGLEWAERRSATLGPVRLSAVAGRRLPLVWATAMLALVGVLFAGFHLEQQGRETMVAANIPPAAPVTVAGTPQQVVADRASDRAVAPAPVRGANPRIAEDNRLLRAIDRELNSGESLLVPVSELRTSGGKVQRRLND